jgi:hypothetical protein
VSFSTGLARGRLECGWEQAESTPVRLRCRMLGERQPFEIDEAPPLERRPCAAVRLGPAEVPRIVGNLLRPLRREGDVSPGRVPARRGTRRGRSGATGSSEWCDRCARPRDDGFDLSVHRRFRRINSGIAVEPCRRSVFQFFVPPGSPSSTSSTEKRSAGRCSGSSCHPGRLATVPARRTDRWTGQWISS